MKLLKFKKSFAFTALTAIAILAAGGTAASAAGTWSENFDSIVDASLWWDVPSTADHITYSIDEGRMCIDNAKGNKSGETSSKNIDGVTATGKLTIEGGMFGLSRISNNDDQYDHILAFRNNEDVIFSLKFNNQKPGRDDRYKVLAAGADEEYKLLVDSDGNAPDDYTTDFTFKADVDLILGTVAVSIAFGDVTYTCDPFSCTVDSINNLIMDATIGSSGTNSASALRLDDLSVVGEDAEEPETKSDTWTFNAPLSQMGGMSLHVDYTEGESVEKNISKTLAELGWETTVSGNGETNLAITFTDIPEDVAITSVTIK